MLENRKQKKGNRRKRVYVSADLVAQLKTLAREVFETSNKVHSWRSYAAVLE